MSSTRSLKTNGRRLFLSAAGIVIFSIAFYIGRHVHQHLQDVTYGESGQPYRSCWFSYVYSVWFILGPLSPFILAFIAYVTERTTSIAEGRSWDPFGRLWPIGLFIIAILGAILGFAQWSDMHRAESCI